MATYRSIATTETDPQAPITSALMKALDGNVTSAFEGDATAVAAGVTLKDPALDTGAATAAGVTWVGLRMAAATAGGVGTYAFLGISGGNTATAFGATRAGSDLTPAGLVKDAAAAMLGTVSGGTRAGTWRCMGNFTTTTTSGSSFSATLWLRIA